MKYLSTQNLFWAIVWAVMLICGITGLFWKPSLYVAIIISAIMVGVFIREYISIVKNK